MFKKLKEKITEEVKISPQRFQQLTQTVTDKLQNTQTSFDENFFSIGDDDANTSAASTDQGFSSVSLVSPSESRIRRNSNSSMASDISFLPRYESGSMYHLQSDLDVSASEMEDNASSSSQIGHLSKEQIYSAFQKSQIRYHKYRGRYTDLARHYKELERENAKMKSVLVDTQDKAIRRVTELKEQCALEQKAKAHLESALRDELDEKQFKIQTLETKVGLLQTNEVPLVDLDKKEVNSDEDNLENLTKYLRDARKEIEILNSKIQELKANGIVFQSKVQEYKSKISSQEEEIAQFYEREKENNLKLAQSKMELHNEILLKDSEISKLKKDIKGLKSSLEVYEKEEKPNTKMENLQTQNKKLIDKVESLTQKCNNLESELLKVEKYKIEINELNEKNSAVLKENEKLIEENSIIKDGLKSCHENIKELSDEKLSLVEHITEGKKEYENQLATLRESAKKGLLSLESKIRMKIQNEFSQKEEQLKHAFTQKIEEMSLSNNSVKEIQIALFKKEDNLKKLTEEIHDLQEKLHSKKKQYDELEKNHLELIEESTKLRSTVSNIEKEMSAAVKSKNNNDEKIACLQANINTLQEEIVNLNNLCQKKENDNIILSQETLKLETINKDLLVKLRLLEEKQEVVEIEGNESKLLELKVQQLEEEKKYLLDEFEMERKMFNEILENNKELKTKEEQLSKFEETFQKMEEKIFDLKQHLNKQKEENAHLQKLKLGLEQQVTKLKETVRLFEEKDEVLQLDQTECSLLEMKVRQLEDEKENLLKTFEMERKDFDRAIHEHKEQHVETVQHKEEKDEENVILAKENLKLRAENDELTHKVRLFEERQENIELEESESKLLELKVQKLEEERKYLLEEFEMERKMFNEILENNKELKVKEAMIMQIEETNKNLEEKIVELKGYIHKKENDNAELQKHKLHLEQEVEKLKETIRIFEEKNEAMELDTTEYELLKLKLNSLENEKDSLLKSFEFERKDFAEIYNKNELYYKELKDLNSKVEILTKENEDLTEGNTVKANEIKILSEKVEQLQGDINKQRSEFGNLTEKSKKLEEMIRTVHNENTESLKQEKEQQNILTAKLNDLQNELQEKCIELEEVKKKFDEVATLYNNEKDKQSEEHSNVQSQLVALEDSFKMMAKDKQVVEDELLTLRTMDSKFKRIQDEKVNLENKVQLLEAEKSNVEVELNKKISECEEIKFIRQEKDNLLKEVTELRLKTKELMTENSKLQADVDNLNKEISELKLRNTQISSDNKNITEENESLLHNIEGLKKENTEFSQSKRNLEEVENKLKETVQELQHKNQILTEQNVTSANNIDLAKLQTDFYEIKAKCDNLYVENKNLTGEYNKLQAKCNDFSKIKKNLETQISEIEHQYSEITHEKQLLLDEVQELKISPINNASKLENLELLKQPNAFKVGSSNTTLEEEKYIKEINILRDKLTQYKSLDITNKSSIEFYENELQKMKNKNEKLNQKLDDTLVTLNHCAELSSSTEIEYLRNVVYNYMLGKESLVLARVIAAVCKFDPEQTEAILQKEQQKQTLLGQLGIL